MLKSSHLYLVPISLFSLTIVSSAVLAATTVSAEDSVIDDMSVSVPLSCTISGTGMNSHNKTIAPGTEESGIGETTMTVVCNDSGGFAIYAIGYTDDTYGKNVLSNASLGSTNDIATGTGNTGNSQWSMKLATPTSPTPTYPMTVQNSFDSASYHVVPDDYMLVAKRTAATDTGDGAEGSVLTSTYKAYISQTQVPGTYTGQVLYTLVHPNGAPAPQGPKDDISDIAFMQEFATLTAEEKTDVLDSMELHELYPIVDERDDKPYWIAKMNDGNVWMTQNLDFDIVDGGADLDSTNTDVPSDWADAGSLTDTSQDVTWDTSYVVQPLSYDPGDLCWDGVVTTSGGTLQDNTYDCSEDDFENWVYHVGNYYNWTAAVAMSDSSSYSGFYDVNQSICPAGWTLGKVSNQFPDGTFALLAQMENFTAGTSGNIHQSPNYFVYSGRWYGSSVGVGGLGAYWSSVADGDGSAYDFHFDAGGGLGPGGGANRSYGSSVRCVAR